MKKSTIAIIATLAVLGTAVVVLLALSREGIAARQQLREDAVFLVVYNDVERRVTVEDIQALEPEDFDANYNRSGRPAEIRTFYGVPFLRVLEHLELDLTPLERAVFAASDGYVSALPIADIFAAYIALCDDLGPFRMVLPDDPFSQRWVHWLTDVTLS